MTETELPPQWYRDHVEDPNWCNIKRFTKQELESVIASPHSSSSLKYLCKFELEHRKPKPQEEWGNDRKTMRPR